MFNYIKLKLKNRLSGWFARYLSLGGKEVLHKAVALAIPVYANFWWHTVEHRKKIHWMKWEKLCLPKELGGFDFKHLESFNQALLAKQAWKMLQNPNSLIARLLKSRYFDVESFLEAKMGNRPSYGWRCILHGRDLLMRGLRKEIGNGISVKVWTEPWCDFGGRRNPWMKNPIIDLEMKVSELINQETCE